TSTDQNKTTYRRFIREGFNEGRLDAGEELLSPAYVFHDAPPGTPTSRDGGKQMGSLFRAAFPHLEITIEDQVAAEDKVCSRTILRGTHKGTIFGIPATGKNVSMTGLTMVRIVGGRLVESWVKNDIIGLMTELGAMPSQK